MDETYLKVMGLGITETGEPDFAGVHINMPMELFNIDKISKLLNVSVDAIMVIDKEEYDRDYEYSVEEGVDLGALDEKRRKENT